MLLFDRKRAPDGRAVACLVWTKSESEIVTRLASADRRKERRRRRPPLGGDQSPVPTAIGWCSAVGVRSARAISRRPTLILTSIRLRRVCLVALASTASRAKRATDASERGRVVVVLSGRARISFQDCCIAIKQERDPSPLNVLVLLTRGTARVNVATHGHQKYWGPLIGKCRSTTRGLRREEDKTACELVLPWTGRRVYVPTPRTFASTSRARRAPGRESRLLRGPTARHSAG